MLLNRISELRNVHELRLIYIDGDPSGSPGDPSGTPQTDIYSCPANLRGMFLNSRTFGSLYMIYIV